MKTVYKALNNQDKVTMKHFYHRRCDPDLDEGFCAIRHIPCACTGCVEQLSKTWLPNLYKNLQPSYVIEPETCKYSSILRGYNKWYIFQIDFKEKKQQTQTRWRLKTSLSCTAWLWQQQTRLNTIPFVNFKPATAPRLDIILFDGQVMYITYRKDIHVMHLIVQF